jgi:hypothetical protein
MRSAECDGKEAASVLAPDWPAQESEQVTDLVDLYRVDESVNLPFDPNLRAAVA